MIYHKGKQCRRSLRKTTLTCRMEDGSEGKFNVISQNYTLSEVWSGVNWADLMAAQGDFGTDFYDRSTRTIVGTMV